MRAVLDTNVLVRATRGGSGPADIVRNLLTEPHLLILSPFLLSELSRVLRYDRVRAVHGLDEAGMDGFVQHLRCAALLVNPPSGMATKVVSPDPNDDPIVATAVVGQAEVLCTLDRHFRHPDVLTYCAQHGLRILSDIALLQELRGLASPPSGIP